MKFRLALLNEDQQYIRKLCTSLESRYPDKLEICTFSDAAGIAASAERSSFDVVIADEESSVGPESFSKRTAFAFFTDSPDIGRIRDYPVVCRFQKIDAIYRQILAVYAEKAEDISAVSESARTPCSVILFSSAAGGVGTSSIAAAAAMHFAGTGIRTLYLDLGTYGNAELFFRSDGRQGMSDLIYAMKNRNLNLRLKLQSAVLQDESGVYFFRPPAVPLDMLELTTGEKAELIRILQDSGDFDCILVDLDFDLSEIRALLLNAECLIMVSDGSEIAADKTVRALQVMRILDGQDRTALMPRTKLVYNRLSSQSGRMLQGISADVIGGARRFEGEDQRMIVEELSRMAFFPLILREQS